MYTTDYYSDLGIFLYYTPIVSSFSVAFALLVKRQRTYPQLWLSFVFIMLGIGMTASFIFDRYLSTMHSEILRPVNFVCSTAISVFAFFYYISLMRPHLLTKKFIAAFCCGWSLFALFTILPGAIYSGDHPVQDIHQISISSVPTIFRLVSNGCLIVFDVWLTIYVIKIYRSYRKFISNVYSFAEGITLSWVSITIIMFILMGSLDMIWMVNSSSSFKILFNIVSLGTIWTIFYFGFRQDIIPQDEPEEEKLAEEQELEDETPTSYAEREQKLKSDLLNYFAEKTPYLNPDLSLKDISKELNMSHYTLSRFINKEFGTNFYTLVNRFRIEYILHLIEINKTAVNCDMLHAVSGFKSRTVFFRQFKEITGVTPQEYIEKRMRKK